MKIWSDAVDLARRTPPGRNRYVDFLRALAILVVVFGHWLVSAPQLTESGLAVTSMLGVAVWTHPLTWALQVMPVFFIVGGYANGASWEAARRGDVGYRRWLHGRLRRLVAPLLPLILAWAGLVFAGAAAGLDPALVSHASRLALIPTWFLAVYIGVVLLVPFAARAWERHGLASFWLPVSAAVLIDALAFGHGMTVLRWANYIFVWFAVHQLGFFWRSGRASKAAVATAWLAAGLSVLVFLVEVAGYPVAMLTVPGADFSNTRPPTVALAALAALHFGLLNLLEPVVSRWLQRPRAWAATVLVNAFIMTIFLWHSTVNALAVGAAAALGGIGLHFEPGSAAWWLARPVWLTTLSVALLPFIALFGRFERGRRGAATAGGAVPTVQVVGALCLCLGVGMLAGLGMGTASFPWLRVWPLVLALAGAAAVLWRGGTPR